MNYLLSKSVHPKEGNEPCFKGTTRTTHKQRIALSNMTDACYHLGFYCMSKSSWGAVRHYLNINYVKVWR